MTRQEYIVDQLVTKQSGYTFFDLMVASGQMDVAEKGDWEKFVDFLSAFKISRPVSLGGMQAPLAA